MLVGVMVEDDTPRPIRDVPLLDHDACGRFPLIAFFSGGSVDRVLSGCW
jgi:hypothetical protein